MARRTTHKGSMLIVQTIVLITLSIACMVFDARKEIPSVRENIQTYISLPIKSASDWPKDLQKEIASFFIDRTKLTQDNEQLRRKVAWLKANLANQTVLEADYRRLKSLFESTALRSRPMMIAEVLDSQIDANKHQIEINKGHLAEVFEGQAVIDEHGVVGQVTQVTEKAAIVSLITDQRQMIPVFIERNRLRMIARGSGNLDELEMEFVSKSADVRVGDKLVTSGLGNRYPRGYSIGVVVSVESSPANEFMQIRAKPLATLDKILEVLLIQSVEPAYLKDKNKHLASRTKKLDKKRRNHKNRKNRRNQESANSNNANNHSETHGAETNENGEETLPGIELESI